MDSNDLTDYNGTWLCDNYLTTLDVVPAEKTEVHVDQADDAEMQEVEGVATDQPERNENPTNWILR